MGMFTKPLEKIKHSGLVDNKYFNAKDALFLGAVGAGAGAGYFASDGDFEQTVNGGIFGVTGGVLARYGAKKYRNGIKNFTKNMVNEANDNQANRDIAMSMYSSIGNSKLMKGDYAALGTIVGGSMAVGGLSGALSGAIGNATGAGTTATGGAIEGAAILSAGASIASLIGNRGGGLIRFGAGGLGAVAIGTGAAIAGGYEGLTAEDGGIQKAIIKGAVYGKLAKTATMLGTERYGSSFITKKAASLGGNE